MAKKVISRANPKLLRWCRERAGFDVAQVAKWEKLKPSTIEDWEAGIGSPSLSRLRKLATRYKRPVHVFYLPDVPAALGFSIVELKDFRTLRNEELRRRSPALEFAIRSAQERQEWAHQFLLEDGAPAVSLIGNAKRTESISEVASRIRSMLGVTMEEQVSCSGSHSALALWREAVESLGVFVFQTKGVEVAEMRGFAIPDEFAPVIAINAKDSPTARVFTLIHELVHIFLGESAITGQEVFAGDALDPTGTEQFCNQVAANVLIPEADFRARIADRFPSIRIEALSGLSSTYGVSRAVIAMRLYELGFASDEFLERALVMVAIQKSEKKEDPRIPQFRLAIARNGEYFSRTALSAFRKRNIHGGQLSALLNMKLQYLTQLESHLFPQRFFASAR